MKTEEYQKLEAVLKRGKANELKRVKKEQLLDFISDMTKKVAEEKEEISAELETAKLISENYESTQETLEEYKKLLEELKTKNSGLYAQIDELQEACLELQNQDKTKRSWIWGLGAAVVVLVVIIILTLL